MTAADEGEGEEEEDSDVLVPPEADPAKKSSTGEIDTSRMSAASWAAIDKETANDFDSSVSAAITNSAATVAADSDYLVFTTDGDIIEPLRVGSGYADRMLTELVEKVDHMVSPLQKDLERAISARSLSVYSAGHRSGRLHSANLSRLATGDDRVFRRRHDATSKDVAVMLVVDASGSMGGSKIHTATQTAYALASTLERIGIKCEVICFTTGAVTADRSLLQAETAKLGRSYSRIESLYMPILKGFDERLTSEVKKRFAWLPNSSILASNVDGECVEVAARRLLGRRETGKVMMVLSDGAPAASGGSRPLEAHLKRTIQNIIKIGVNVIGIGIESEAVQKFYPKHLVLRSVSELPGAVMKELRGLIVKN
ncbi:hypothetical protein LP414_27175 [Polaromonas sp. P1(28)-13]|nr:hypothetical protein LP414_27175 [Polaromonas sp. P1(28)-13]